MASNMDNSLHSCYCLINIVSHNPVTLAKMVNFCSYVLNALILPLVHVNIVWFIHLTSLPNN